MRAIRLCFLGFTLLGNSMAQLPSLSQSPIPAITQKPGSWDTLKLVNPAPTPNDARNFGTAFPIGNGRLGAKVFGWPASEVIPLNDTTFWSGPGPEHFEDAKHHEALAATRAALLAPDYVKADQLVRGMEGPNTQFYEPLADLHIAFPGHDAFTNYSNTLDLDRAVATTRYTVGGTTYTREMFVSYPAQVIVLRLTADKPGALTFTVGLHSAALWADERERERDIGDRTCPCSNLRSHSERERRVGRTQGHDDGDAAACLRKGR
jgi:hypothetical protein